MKAKDATAQIGQGE